MSNVDLSGVRDFDFLLGTWRVTHHRLVGRLTGATEWDTGYGIDIIRPAFNGLGNIGCFRRDLNGEHYEGAPIRLYDPRDGLWRIYWLDTAEYRMEPPVVGRFVEGEGEFIGDDVLREMPIKVRYRWTLITTNSATWDQSYSADEGKTWEQNSIMEFKRDDLVCDDMRPPFGPYE
ncbi:MAG: hypothetical protein AAF358_11545 [Pseudomonadota bacterium]